MKLAYFSPLPPLKSGIADYSVELLLAMRHLATIDLFVAGYEVSDKRLINAFKIYNISEFPSRKRVDGYDLNVYHIGNNHLYHEDIYKMALSEPGLVVLHDVYIHNMVAAMLYGHGKSEEYVAEMRYNFGEEGERVAREFLNGVGKAPWERDGLPYPMTKRLVDRAKGVIVHSLYAREHVKSQRESVPVEVVKHHSEVIVEDEKAERFAARKRLGIPDDTVIFASFGYISPNRRIDEILKAVCRLSSLSGRVVFYLVGEVSEPGYKVEELVRDMGLEGKVFITGYADMDYYLDIMKAADICFNLRYPYYGETSGNLHRMLGLGKVVFVSDIGGFREYPDDCLIKVPVGNESEVLALQIERLMTHPRLRERISQHALAYAKEYCTLEVAAHNYVAFADQIRRGLEKVESFIEETARQLLHDGVNSDEELMLRAVAERIVDMALEERPRREGS
ncbi:D-inositol-3-phosphate glycosyltransferase [Peptococcaceae bacterium CEB3]|nr:D-inositol-3-phosphate glycosyltransferase [Peptococcaceae bacterium CEB3]